MSNKNQADLPIGGINAVSLDNSNISMAQVYKVIKIIKYLKVNTELLLSFAHHSPPGSCLGDGSMFKQTSFGWIQQILVFVNSSDGGCC